MTGGDALKALSLRLVALVVALTLGFALIEFAFIGRLEYNFDEAYYLLWSRDLAWGYLDHPPGVAAWIRASTTLFGNSEFGVRALGVGVNALATGLIGVVAARLFNSARVGVFAALAWATIPVSAGAIVATPDAPLTIGSALALAGLVEVWRGRALGWAGVGVALGLALLAKFTALFLGAGVALAMIVVPSLRRWWRSPLPYLAAFVAFAIAAPFVAWNATHGWATFAKQFARVPAEHFEPHFVAEFVSSQFALANPLFALATVAWLVGAARRREAVVGRDAEARRLLLAYVAPALAYFLLHALHQRVEGNWTAPLYPAFAILVGAAAVEGARWMRRTIRIGFGVGAAAMALMFVHLATFWPMFGPADPLSRVDGWRALAAQVDARARAEGAAYVFVHNYALASELKVYGAAEPPKIEAEEPERWTFAAEPELKLFRGRGLAIGDAGRDFATALGFRFRQVEFLGRLTRRAGGVEVTDYELYRVSGPFDDDPR